jgi:Dolichyl-phosphate-mannose-protein mannosyltransferase
MQSVSLLLNNIRSKSTLIVVIPLALSAFTHLWNPIGFPSIYVDEAHYMRRTMNLIEGHGPQESAEIFQHPYDHPYFGQLFLASIIGVINYPYSLNLSSSSDTIQSVEMMYAIPRLFMGVLAVIDTFVIYKIAERRYNGKVAFIASILFAVMPSGWFIRRIWLESIQLPLLLVSILLVLRQPKKQTEARDNRGLEKDKILLVLISGLLLGLSIYTKIPAITMIPLVGYLVYTYSSRNLSILGLWFIPVISIPLIWPAYALSLGHFEEWYTDVFWQASRVGEGDTVSRVIIDLLKLDPVLMVLGAIGLILSAVKKDLFLFLWILPYVIFSYAIVHSSFWYFVPLMPAFCIGGAKLIEFMTNLTREKRVRRILTFGIILAIGIFGLVSTFMLITANVTSSYFKASEFIINSLSARSEIESDQVLVTGGVGLASYTWIPLYVFGLNHDFRMVHILLSSDNPPVNSTYMLLVVDKLFDNTMRALMNLHGEYGLNSTKKVVSSYNNTETIAIFTGNSERYDIQTYPYYAMKFNNQLTPSGPDRIDIRANYLPLLAE